MHARARERARERNSLTKKDKIYFDWFCYIEFSSAVRKYLECVLIDHHAASTQSLQSLLSTIGCSGELDVSA